MDAYFCEETEEGERLMLALVHAQLQAGYERCFGSDRSPLVIAARERADEALIAYCAYRAIRRVIAAEGG